ncbi:trans-2,3-enoyl-CoA reductase-like isoform X1 [Lates japonicus]|uniref:Trans-2,3-enoyl-CoA reductase-like isoform X1 n=1 Tax=Lates japonicus TaxID=270547 RepID=A0AAD3R1F5_LATJO|nr:trans-2,3-enoyl-CoA reductase-like isoform X1 [Lates japonicus]
MGPKPAICPKAKVQRGPRCAPLPSPWPSQSRCQGAERMSSQMSPSVRQEQENEQWAKPNNRHVRPQKVGPVLRDDCVQRSISSRSLLSMYSSDVGRQVGWSTLIKAAGNTNNRLQRLGPNTCMRSRALFPRSREPLCLTSKVV